MLFCNVEFQRGYHLENERGVNVVECYFSMWNFNVDITWKTITDSRGIHVEK